MEPAPAGTLGSVCGPSLLVHMEACDHGSSGTGSEKAGFTPSSSKHTPGKKSVLSPNHGFVFKVIRWSVQDRAPPVHTFLNKQAPPAASSQHSPSSGHPGSQRTLLRTNSLSCYS